MAAERHSVLYARVCFRLALQRDHNALERLGLTGVQSGFRAGLSNGSFSGRFDAPGFPVLYAAEEPQTCEAEVSHHLVTHYLRHTSGLRPQIFEYRLLEVPLSGLFEDLRKASLAGLQAPTLWAYPVCRQYAFASFQAGMDGLLYASARRRGGTCVARFLPNGLRIPVREVGVRVLEWTGRKLVIKP